MKKTLYSSLLGLAAGTAIWLLLAAGTPVNYYGNFIGGGNGVTNLHYAYITNAFPGAAGMSFGGNVYKTNIQVNTTLAAFANVSPYFYETLIIYATNPTAGDLNLTFPNGVTDWTNGAPVTIICSNKQLTKIHVDHYAQDHTNAYRFPQ